MSVPQLHGPGQFLCFGKKVFSTFPYLGEGGRVDHPYLGQGQPDSGF